MFRLSTVALLGAEAVGSNVDCPAQDEASLLQMPVVQNTLDATDSECRCPGYYQEECEAEAAQGCIWSSAGTSNSPWCQCDESVVPPPFVPGPIVEPLPPVVAPLQFDQSGTNNWCGTSNNDFYTQTSSSRSGWNLDTSSNGGWRWCGITADECQTECTGLGDCQEIYWTPNSCCFPSRAVCNTGSHAPGGAGGMRYIVVPEVEVKGPCSDYFGDMEGVVTVADPDVGHTSASSPYCEGNGMSSPCIYMHLAGPANECQSPGPPDGCHRYHTVKYSECSELDAFNAESRIDTTDAFDTEGVFKLCADRVISNEVNCYGPPADLPQACDCSLAGPEEPFPPDVAPLQFDQSGTNNWCGTSNNDFYTQTSSSRSGWNLDTSSNGGWRWCGITADECQTECTGLGGCQEIYWTPNGCCFPSRAVCNTGSHAPGGSGGMRYIVVPELVEDLPELANHGANCWNPCGQTAGACEYCGTEGFCCREGFAGDPEECGGRGAPNFHTCILPDEEPEEPEELAPLQNEGENCWNPCDRTAGACEYCGTEGLCCREGFGSDPAECGGRGASNFHTCILPEDEPEETALQNQGENCWNPCDQTAGSCDYCGTEGLCCREGFGSDPAECGGRGAPNFHTCVLPVVPTILQNQGANCWNPCDQTAGPCDFCGTEGVCCRQGFASDPEECGGLGAPNFHTCILPVEMEEEPQYPDTEIPEQTEWTLIAHHVLSGGLFADATRNTFIENAGNPFASTYMIAGQVTPSDYLVDGKYQLRLEYNDLDDAHLPCNDGPPLSGSVTLEWLQSSWVTAETVTGFEAISPSDLSTSAGGAGCQFSGLARSSGDNTVLDGSHQHGYWFGSVGAVETWSGGIPAWKGGVAQSMSLYVKR